jgi:OmpA-OmpF porin, OOP family
MTRISSRFCTRSRALPLLALASLAPFIALPTQAQDSTRYGYGGLAVGPSRSHLNDQQGADTALGGASTATGLVEDHRHTGYRVFGGMQMTRNWALEAAYFDLGNFTFTSGTSLGGTLNGKLKLQGASLDLVGTVPLGERAALLGRVGATYAKSRNAFTGTAPVVDATPSKRETNAKVGVGLQYAFSPAFQMRTEYERYRMADAMGGRGNVDLVSVSLVFPFGRRGDGMMRTGSRDNAAPPMAQAAPEQAPIDAPALSGFAEPTAAAPPIASAMR